MKRFQWICALLLPILAQCAHADSVFTFFAQANIGFSTDVSGDNQLFSFNGPGVSLVGSGDLSCFWCGLQVFSLTPGSSITPSVGNAGLDFTFTQGFLTFDGQPQVCGAGNCSLFVSGITSLSSFTFPTNGRNFTVTVPAILNGPIGGQLETVNTFHQFALQIPQGRLVLTFDFEGATGGAPAYYQFSRGMFTTTPEPGTFGLMASGLAAIVGSVLRQRNRRRFPKTFMNTA
jgi:hypothetical protein